MKRKFLVFGLVTMGLVWLAFSSTPRTYAAGSASFLVNQTADLDDANRFDNRCDTSLLQPGNQCSLRAAIQQSNHTDGTDTILFASSAAHGLSRDGLEDDNANRGDLDITDSVNIEGHLPSTTINGNGIDRVFDIRSGVVTMKDLIVRGGHNNGGGYRVNCAANITLTNVVVRENSALEGPGGIASCGALTLERSSIISNTNSDGEDVSDLAVSGPLTMFDSRVGDLRISGTAMIVNSTMSTTIGLGLASLRNATVNTLRICHFDPTFAPCGLPNTTNLFNSIVESCSGTFSSLGYNLVADTNECTLTGNQAGNLLNVNPKLGRLGSNGGPTLTRALLAGSPAIDGGNPSGCVFGNNVPLLSDQRGLPRPTDGDGDGTARCDIGAFEAGAVGIGALSPKRGASKPGEQVLFHLAWDSPTRWRDLNTLDLRFKRGIEIVLWVSFTEGLPNSTLSLLDDEGNVVDSGNIGAAKVLKNKFGELDLAQSSFTASGPNDPHVVLHLAVRFHKKAEGKLVVQALATDDFANAQGPEPVGTWKVKNK